MGTARLTRALDERGKEINLPRTEKYGIVKRKVGESRKT